MSHDLPDIMWVVLCSALVLLMQGGFCCLESGLVRSKNSINVALKNLVDICVAAALFWAFGYALMFGASRGGWIGGSGFFLIDNQQPWVLAFFLFQLVFCGTATTIVSGAVAERMRFAGYLAVTVIVAGLIYPVIGHWAWGGLADGTTTGWLKGLGFIDFAGSTVVHSVGGWVALAAILVIGPRLGRFGKDGSAIRGHNVPIAALGVILLWFGWFGFNGGSTLRLDESIPLILVNTSIAASFGALTGLSISWLVVHRPQVQDTINGVIAGLVGITAACNIVSPLSAACIGAVAGMICFGACRLLERWQIDDVIGAVPAHACAGVWGTLAVALFGHHSAWQAGLTWWQQLGIQAMGAAVCFAWSFGVAFPVLWLLNRFFALRVCPADERQGLNIAEHGASTDLVELVTEMEDQRRSADYSHPVTVEPHTEFGQIAAQYNRVLERVNAEIEQRERSAVELVAKNVQLNEARIAADAANQAKSEFLANMSHEIRTPMTAILGHSELLLEAEQSAEDRTECVETIRGNGEHLLTIINDILDLAKIESGKLRIERIESALYEIINAVASLMRVRALEKGLTLDVEYAFPIPEKIETDPTRLRQILINLVSNAIKCSHSGGVRIIARASSGDAPDARISIEVVDTGIGMTPDQMKELFQPFAQADTSTTRNFGGTGLGLTISQRLARALGGQIKVQSIPGTGSSFTLTIDPGHLHGVKMLHDLHESVQSMADPKPPPAPSERLEGRVLFAEDNLVNQKLIARILTKAGLEVELADNGAIAFDKAMQALDEPHPFDVILMDMQMPVMDGYEAVSQLRSKQYRGPIIAITAHAMPGDREKCIDAGCDGYTTKPVNRAKLIELVGRAMADRSANHDGRATSSDTPRPGEDPDATRSAA